MRGIAYAGAMSNPSVKTFTAAISQSTRRARGTEPGRRLIPAPVATHRPAAPSVSGDAFPAVIVPLPLVRSKAGCSFARRSRLRRVQLRQALEARVRARKTVARHAFDRNDQIVEESGFLPC